MPFFGIKALPHECRLSLRMWSVSCTFDPLTGRSSVDNMRCACYFSPLSTSFVFHALNVIRFSCVGLCGNMRHSCDRDFSRTLTLECVISKNGFDHYGTSPCIIIIIMQKVERGNLRQIFPPSNKVSTKKVWNILETIILKHFWSYLDMRCIVLYTIDMHVLSALKCYYICHHRQFQSWDNCLLEVV